MRRWCMFRHMGQEAGLCEKLSDAGGEAGILVGYRMYLRLSELFYENDAKEQKELEDEGD